MWERECLDQLPANRNLTLAECQDLIAQVCRRYGVRVPPIRDGRGRRSACWSIRGIALPRWARTTVVALHETAHAIHHHTSRLRGQADHGPEFVRLFIELLAHCKVGTKGELLKSAKVHRVRIASPGSCPQPSGWEGKLRAELESLVRRYAQIYALPEAEVSKAVGQIIHTG